MTAAARFVLAFAVAAGGALLAAAAQDPPVRLPSIQFPPAPLPAPPVAQPPGGRARPRFGQVEGQMPPFMQLERQPIANLDAGQVPYDGRFVFARLRFTEGVSLDELGSGRGFGRRFGRGMGPPWSHDYPRAERFFAKILGEITSIQPYMGPLGGVIVDIGSKDLFRFPVAYMAEAGYWTQSAEEAANVGAYLRKGGFIIFDDFRGGDLANFETQLNRALPGVRLIELDISHPVFHAFFDIATLDFVQFYGRGERPIFFGAFEDNDPSKRLLLVANYNNDIGEYWEYSDTGWTPIDLSNEAYKLGVNYVIYALTH